jgi:hypothetical protein|tara:strand:- start:134 stop:346 length:213 start_codon:yes stop_codon:yes gene_type:complete
MVIISEKNIDMILFNMRYLVGTELEYIGYAAGRGHLSGNGYRANSTFRKNLYLKKSNRTRISLIDFQKEV